MNEKRGEYSCHSRVTESSDAQRVEEKYRELNELVDRFIENLYKEWASNVSEASKFNLNQHLITRNPKNHLIQLNFHPQVNPFFLLLFPLPSMIFI